MLRCADQKVGSLIFQFSMDMPDSLHPLLILFLALALTGHCGEPLTVADYVAAGLESNLTLQREQVDYQKSIETLAIAKSFFWPNVKIESRHTRGGGGRIFEVPTGDLLNPVYGSLNALLTIHRTAGDLPPGPLFNTNVENDIFRVIRKEDHESRIMVTMPVYQPAIVHNYRAQRNLKEAKFANVQDFRLQLTKNITAACFELLKARRIHELLSDTLTPVRENLASSIEFVQGGLGTEDVAYKAEAELRETEAKEFAAAHAATQAEMYLNFLVNRSLDVPVAIDDRIPLPEPGAAAALLEEANPVAAQSWKLTALSRVAQARNHAVKAAEAPFKPELFAVFDAGYEGERWRYLRDDPYWRATMVLSWNIFRGFQDIHKRREALLSRAQAAMEWDAAQQQLAFETTRRISDFEFARKSVDGTDARLKAARTRFGLVREKFELRQAGPVEMLAALTEYTKAGIDYATAFYDCHIRYAECEAMMGGAPEEP